MQHQNQRPQMTRGGFHNNNRNNNQMRQGGQGNQGSGRMRVPPQVTLQIHPTHQLS
jgi:hypothetical protein